MRRRILNQTRFRKPAAGWAWPKMPTDWLGPATRGAILSATNGQSANLGGPGVHTRNGDSIELTFQPLTPKRGGLVFGFSGGMESAVVRLDFNKRRIFLSTSDWTIPDPLVSAPLKRFGRASHRLTIEKTDGPGARVKNADLRVLLDGEPVLSARNVNVLPELGVVVRAKDTRVLLERFVHRGAPSGVPETLHVGGWQLPNKSAIDVNFASICRGLRKAAEAGVELLVTSETSLTGLFPSHAVTQRPGPIAAAEKRLRKFLRALPNAPYLVAGLPMWRRVTGHRRPQTRYNISRVYDPDGETVLTGAKIHSCEPNFWHGLRYQEFDICGVPVSMHICHDGRYPDVWTLPVMFGARLVLHPANGGNVSGSVDAFEAGARRGTTTSHAFYLHVNGGGGSYLVGPQKFDNVIAVSDECRRDNSSFPVVGPARECLFHAPIRIHDAYGYWPVRSYRASEATAEAFVALYRSMGGLRV